MPVECKQKAQHKMTFIFSIHSFSGLSLGMFWTAAAKQQQKTNVQSVSIRFPDEIHVAHAHAHLFAASSGSLLWIRASEENNTHYYLIIFTLRSQSQLTVLARAHFFLANILQFKCYHRYVVHFKIVVSASMDSSYTFLVIRSCLFHSLVLYHTDSFSFCTTLLLYTLVNIWW